jgi:hypothetical protein
LFVSVFLVLWLNAVTGVFYWAILFPREAIGNRLGQSVENLMFDDLRKWFNEQVSPENGRSCCSIADGHETQEQIRHGQYWVLIEGNWFPVPPSRVIHGKGNPVGRPIVWYQKFPSPDDGDKPIVPEINIMCFVPGAGI